jgi:hypothetical protein
MTRARRISCYLPMMVTDGRRGIRQHCLLLLILLGSYASSFMYIGVGVVDAFAPLPPVTTTSLKITSTTTGRNTRRLSHTNGPAIIGDWLHKRKHTRQQHTQQLFSNRNDDENDNNDNWLSKRLDKADVIEIRNDAALVACYVLCRFFIYDITTGTKITPGFEIQDIIWLTGTFSSATVLVMYWTLAGLLSRSYESSNNSNSSSSNSSPLSIYQTLVNVTLCCPIWLATEHYLHFGPSNIGGDTLSIAVGTGFIGLGSFMVLAKLITTTTFGGGTE